MALQYKLLALYILLFVRLCTQMRCAWSLTRTANVSIPKSFWLNVNIISCYEEILQFLLLIVSIINRYSPNIKEIKVVKHRKVRRARLYYLRDKLPRLSTFKWDIIDAPTVASFQLYFSWIKKSWITVICMNSFCRWRQGINIVLDNCIFTLEFTKKNIDTTLLPNSSNFSSWAEV